MRCGCPQCGAFMIHSERDNACVCPDCLYRCYACQGTGTALSLEAVQALKDLPIVPSTMEERMQKEARQQGDL